MKIMDRVRSALRGNESGMAVVEFALLVPFLSLSVLMTADAALLIMATQKVARTAATMADLTAQSEAGTSEAQMSDALEAARILMQPGNLDEDGRVYVTAVQGGASGIGNFILWQRCTGGLTTEKSQLSNATNRDVELPGGILLDQNQLVIVAEAYLDYTPIFPNAVFKQQTIRQVAVARPRNLSFTLLTPDGSDPQDACGSNVTQPPAN
ncbi:pilus assembly protein [Hankyongella ginsenosidimutans]|uniref:Pilus assembly protein n=1 Tax=Hankyongella ginsenosidimutans TaxID=1763828 RepID=A0A4D7C7L4_9SPHN|nr:TadE/TadG family type IV pilus assembly protein [Hankyongella ginsenosidimutans]QCI80070.1 pilus assembly protein [Hankyongella ginsenosidimutans]TXG83151.1 MAG: pilus assembly protein [Sphingomonadales bacterium]